MNLHERAAEIAARHHHGRGRGKEYAALIAEMDARIVALEADARRLDWLDTLTKRTVVSGHRKEPWPISSDMHFSRNSVALYLRTGIGSDYSASGYADTVREAIDDAARKEQTT